MQYPRTNSCPPLSPSCKMYLPPNVVKGANSWAARAASKHVAHGSYCSPLNQMLHSSPSSSARPHSPPTPFSPCTRPTPHLFRNRAVLVQVHLVLDIFRELREAILVDDGVAADGALPLEEVLPLVLCNDQHLRVGQSINRRWFGTSSRSASEWRAC